MRARVKYFDESLPPICYVGGKDMSNWIDLYTREETEIKEGEMKTIPLNVAIEIPSGYEVMMIPRSSTFKNYGVIMANSIGLFDESYCGDKDEYMFAAYAVKDTVIPKGARVCQIRFIKRQPDIEFERVEHLNEQSRGGFGSTGV